MTGAGARFPAAAVCSTTEAKALLTGDVVYILPCCWVVSVSVGAFVAVGQHWLGVGLWCQNPTAPCTPC